MRLLKIGSAATRTERTEEMIDLFGRILGLRLLHGGEEEGLWAFGLPDGSKVEIFTPSMNEHLVTGPLAEFLTDDLAGAAEQLRAEGLEIVSGPESYGDERWVHFRAPDGNVYGLVERGADTSA
jgi:catechol 2,3-dioxygenase-like lactoylglutathione lyase family enzyme